MKERTLSIIKPDAMRKHVKGEILKRLEAAGLHIVAAKLLHISPSVAAQFYVVHKDKKFYNSLVEFMSSGPILVSVLEGDDAIATNRKVMGATNPAESAAGTIRRDFGTDIEKNAVHGSDATDTARWEIGFFFSQAELHEH
jgi:nucleoside-diphosphate kinase